MNMSSQTMRWSDIDMNEGSQIQTLSSSEVEDVSGAVLVHLGWAIGAAVVTAVAAAVLGYYLARD